LGNLTGLLEKINPAIESETTIVTDRDGSNPVFVDKVAEQNVFKTIERIREESTLIAEYEKEGKIKIVGGMYSVETGAVSFFA
jgi:carbonic anhydrase